MMPSTCEWNNEMGNYISCNTKYKGYNSSVTIIVLLKIVPLDTCSSDQKKRTLVTVKANLLTAIKVTNKYTRCNDLCVVDIN